MRTSRATGLAALALALALALSACSDDGGDITAGAGEGATSDLREKFVDAIVDVTEHPDESSTVERRTCLAESYVDAFGADEMAAAGVTPDDIRSVGEGGASEIGLEFSDDQGADFYDRVTGCMDVRAFLIEAITSDDVPDDVLACLDDELSDEVLEGFITVVYTQGQDELAADRDLQQAIEEAIEPCEAMLDG